MKILEITYNLRPGGAERFIVDLCNNYSQDENNEVYLLAVNKDSGPKDKHYLSSLSKKVHYICANASKGLSIKGLFKIYKIIKELKPDVVHAHSSVLHLLLPSLFQRKIKYIHTLHTLAEKNTSHRKLKLIEKKLYNKYIQAVTISDICNKSFIDYYNSNNSICIPNGREALKTTELHSAISDEINNLKKNSNTPVFIHVATFLKPKNQQLLFDTFKKLEDEGKDFLLVVLGACYENCTHPYKENGKQIVIMGRKENVGDYMACADFFVMSSIWEGLPLSLLEAMSMGVIPICTPAGGIVDVIYNGTNGYLSPSFKLDDFYALIKGVLENPDKISKKDVIKCYEENYTMSICAEKYLDLYKKL